MTTNNNEHIITYEKVGIKKFFLHVSFLSDFIIETVLIRFVCVAFVDTLSITFITFYYTQLLNYQKYFLNIYCYHKYMY